MQHRACDSGSPKPLPSRLVHIDGPQSVRLVETIGKIGQYVALSHCWGSNAVLKTELGTYASRLRFVTWQDLPKTYQHAIDVCLRLGLQYLWIDSLYTMQDSDTDWQTELANMQNIYRNAFITLAATASKDGTGGLYKTQNLTHELVTELTVDQGVPSAIYTRSRWHHQAKEGLYHDFFLPPVEIPPLFQRGWAFQERLLSTRMIHFAANEVQWECRELDTCECRYDSLSETGRYKDTMKTVGRISIHSNLKRAYDTAMADLSPDGAIDLWCILVEKFTSRALTFHSDRLPALSGIARSLQHHGLGDYVAGLWSRFITRCLLWQNLSPVEPPYGSGPSWSWSSFNSSVLFSECRQELDLISFGATPLGPDAYGQVSNAWIKSDVELELVDLLRYDKALRLDGDVSASSTETMIEQDLLFYVRVNEAVLGCFWDDNSIDQWGNGDVLHKCDEERLSLGLCCVRIPGWGYDNLLILHSINCESKTFRRVWLSKTTSVKSGSQKFMEALQHVNRLDRTKSYPGKHIITIL